MPRRSLMGLFVAVVLVLPATAFAGWLQISAGSLTYFLCQEHFNDLDQKGVTRVLYKDPSFLPTKRTKYSLEKQADGGYSIIEFKGQGKKKTKIVVQSGATAKPVPEPAPKKNFVQAGFDKLKGKGDKKTANKSLKGAGSQPSDPVRQAVEKLPANQKAFVLADLEQLKAKEPQRYKKMVEGGQPAIDAMLASIVKKHDDALAKSGSGAAPADEPVTKITAKTKAAPDSEQGKPVGQAGSDGKTTAERNLINDLSALIAANKAAAAADIGARLYQFMTGTAEGDYLAPQLRSDKTTLERLRPVAEAWVAKRLEGEQGPVEMAQLYLVLGSGDASPSWVADAQLSSALASKENQRHGMILDNMKPWTGAPAPGQGKRKPISQAQPDQEAAAFFADASAHAGKILSETRIQKEIRLSVIQNENPIAVPGMIGKGGGITDPLRSFDFEALYGNAGGVSKDVYGPKDSVSRRMSMRIYTVREGDKLVNKIGIYDTTYQSDIFGQKFPIGLGESTFALDDRKPGYPKYTLKVEPMKNGDMEITFMREGGDASKGGSVIHTTLSELQKKRADQAVSGGATVTVKDKTFYVLGQGGSKGGVLFFPSDTAARSAEGESVSPELFAETTQRSENRNVKIPGKRTLGQVDGDDYSLVFNDKLKYWEVIKAKGDDIPPPAPNPAKPGPTDPEKQYDSQTPRGATGDVDTIGVEKGLTGKGEYVRNEEVTAGLDEEYKDSVRVYDWNVKDDNGRPALMEVTGRHPMIVPASVRPERNFYLAFLGTERGTDTTMRKHEVRGIGHYLASTSLKFTAYFDLSKPVPKPAQGAVDTVYEFDGRCVVDETTKAICFKDMVLMGDAMTRGGFSAQDIETALTNAAKAFSQVKGFDEKTSYQISGSKATNLVLAVSEGGSFGIWPKFDAGPGSDGAHAETKPGPTNAFDNKMVPGADAPFPTDVQDAKLDNNAVKLYHIKTEGSGALYADAPKGQEAKIKTWWLMFRLRNNDDKILRTGFIKVLDAEKSLSADKIHVAGLEGRRKPASDITSSGLPRLRRAEGKGVLYVVENKNIDVADDSKSTNSPNCIGPVLWWGMDEAAALKTCKNNGF